MNDLTIRGVREGLSAKKFSASELVRSYFARIRKHNKTLNAYLALSEDSARAAAEAVDEKIAAGESLPPLAGVPYALKDNMVVEGAVTTAGSKILEHYTAPYTAEAVRRMNSAGAVLLGKTNLDEFAMGSSTENSAYGPTKNPWDISRVPGGSSGGSAAAVAAGLAVCALGSDTGGSIRQPAAFSGVVGLKPTYGRVSRYGLMAMASSLDQIGPLTKTVEDAALLLSVLAGGDALDATSVAQPAEDYARQLRDGVRGMKIGVPKEYFEGEIDAAVAESVNAAVHVLEKAGATIKEVSLPHTRSALAVYYIIMPAEVSSNLARYDGIRYGHSIERKKERAAGLGEVYTHSRAEGFGAEAKRRIMLGSYVLSSGYYEAYYLRAQKVKTLVIEDFRRAFKDVDLIAAPTTATPAFKLGEKTSDPLSMYLSDVFTVPVNVAGLPAITLPCGLVEGLPVGFQLIAPHFGEGTMLRAAAEYERAAGPFPRPAMAKEM